MFQIGVCVCVCVCVHVYLELSCALMVFVKSFITIFCLFIDIDVFDCKCMGPHPQALICFHRGSKPICISL